MTEWLDILETHDSVMSEKLTTTKELSEALSDSYIYWKTRINIVEKSHNN